VPALLSALLKMGKEERIELSHSSDIRYMADSPSRLGHEMSNDNPFLGHVRRPSLTIAARPSKGELTCRAGLQR